MDRSAIIKALRDTAQSASNAIAGNVSGPVDLIAAALRAGGLPVNNPIGGSQWMAERGLTREVESGAPRVIGETLGMVTPALATAYAPQIANSVINAQASANRAAASGAKALDSYAGRKVDEIMAAGGLPADILQDMSRGTKSPAIVWHGSPHKFDKFDSSKIGTGEGAQAYGHGLYFAESPDVARSYQVNLTPGGKSLSIDGAKPVMDMGGPGGMPSSSAGRVMNQAIIALQETKDLDRAIAAAKNPEVRVALERLRGRVSFADAGSLYKVDLPDDQIAKMIDWDKPLSQQAIDIRRLMPSLRKSDPQGYSRLVESQMGGPLMEQATGRDLYRALKHSAFESAGIPGIRYLDGGSRGAGQGTSNFVVFPGNENMLRILERNGQPLGLMGVR